MNRKQTEQYLKSIFELRNKIWLAKGKEELPQFLEELNKCLEPQPKKLYKYSALSEYTFDAIKNNYIYICPADKLDDQFECCVNESFKEITKNKKQIDKRFTDELSKMIQESLPFLNDDDVKTVAFGCTKMLFDNDHSFTRKKEFKELTTLISNDNRRMMLSIADKNYNQKYGLTWQKELNRLRKKLPSLIMETWAKVKRDDAIEKTIERAYEMQKTTGIGSLTECNNSQIMWEMYANHYTGVCIEYDASSNRMKGAVLPVLYGNKNQTNLVSLLIRAHLENFLFNLSHGRINSVESEPQYLTKLMLTKYKEWSFQKEWRILGKPGEKHKTSRIKKIFIGKNITEANEKRLIKIAKEKKIEIFRQLDNYETLEIKYERIL